MTTEQTEYQKLQATAKLLGLNPQQSKEALEAAIENITSVPSVAALLDQVTELLETLETATTSGGGGNVDLETILKPSVELHERLLGDKNALIDPYLTGLVNGCRMSQAAIKGVDLDDDELIVPATNSPIKGTKSLSMREVLIKKARKFITFQRGVYMLRSNLSEEALEECKDVMNRLKMEPGDYTIPEK